MVGQPGLLHVLPERLPGLGRVADAAELEPGLRALPGPVGLPLGSVGLGGALALLKSRHSATYRGLPSLPARSREKPTRRLLPG